MNPVNPNTPIHYSHSKRGYIRGLKEVHRITRVTHTPKSPTHPKHSTTHHSNDLSTELVDKSVCNSIPTYKNRAHRLPIDHIAQNLDTAMLELHTKGILTLKAINAALNIKRYYTIRIDRNLFGETSISTSYGRIGSKGQLKHDYFESPEAGNTFLRSTLRKRLNSKKRIGVNYTLSASN